MFRCTHRIASLVLAAVGTLASCGGPDLPSGRVWESEHFRYFTRADDPAPCPAITAHLDRNFEVLKARLAFDWQPGAKVDYYKFRDHDDRDEHGSCPNHFNCAWAAHVESASLFDEHELVHAYLTGTHVPPLLFTEGLAQALSCQTVRSDFPRVSLQDLLVWRPDRANRFGPGDFYDTAAWFVGYVWRKYGGEKFMRLYRTLPRNAEQAEISRAFMEIFGESVEADWSAAFFAVDPQIGCIPLWACEQAALPVDGSVVEWPATCTADNDARTFELSEATSLKVTYQGVMAFPGTCAVGRAPLVFDGVDTPSLNLTQLPGGRYYLFKNGSTDGQISLSKMDSPLSGPSCAVQTPLELDDIHTRVSLALPETELPVAVRLHSSIPRRAALAIDFRDNRSLTMKVDAALCPYCGEDNVGCKPVTSSPERTTLEGEQVLLVRSAEPSADGFVTIQLDLR